jgi:hypothetical protein
LEDRVTPAVFNVNSLADVLNPAPGVVTLRSAIQQANATPGGNTINLTVAGTYKITLPGTAGETDNAAGEFAILPTGGDLTIQNTSGGSVTVDGGRLSRVFDINPNFDPNNPTPKFLVTLQGFTIQNGFVTDANNPDGPNASGGGVRDNGNASLTLNNVVVTNNSATADGGGVVFENVVSVPWTLTANNSTISNNHAGDAGGGIDADGSGKIFINAGSVITNNTSVNQGAGIWLDAVQVGTVFQTANLTVTGAVVRGNTAQTGLGGGIGNAGNGVVTIVGSTVENNFSGATGGGFGDENAQGTLVIQNSLFLNNAAVGDGGGVAAGGPATTLTGSEIKGNSTAASGGGLFANGVTLTVQNVTVAGNTAAVNGGGVELETTGGADLGSQITDTTIAGNSAVNNVQTTGGGVDAAATFTGTVKLVDDTINANFATVGGGVNWSSVIGAAFSVQNTIIAANVAGSNPDVIDFPGTFTDLGGNLIGVRDANNGFNAATDQLGTDAAPLDPRLGPLQNNGGPTAGTGADALVLETELPLFGSPAVDKGLDTGVPAADERGFLRVVGTHSDVGAVEFQPGATVTTLTADAASVLQGKPVKLTAHVVPASAAPNNPVTGSVTFTDGALTLGTVALDATGTATLTVANLPAGTSTVVATYNPDAQARGLGFATSNSTGLQETVTPANVAPAVNLMTSVTTVTTTTLGGTTFTQTVTITVQVTPPAGGAVPTGTVTFFDGTVALNAAPLPLDANGTATLQLTGLPAGAALVGGQSLAAAYTPDAAGTANGYVAAASKPGVLTVGTPAEVVLNQLFKDLLGRPVNATDLAFWVPQLGDLTNPASQAAQQAVQKVTAGIEASAAFQTQEITWLFRNYLGRTPNQNDLSFWLPQFQQGVTIEQAAAIFVTSPEFIGKNGGTSDGTAGGIPSQQLITAVFQSALGRAPQPQDFQAVAGQTLRQLVNSVFNSAEYHGHTVDVFYQDFLRRTAKNGEATFWMNFYPGGAGANLVPAGEQPDLFIVSGIIGSQEYIQNAEGNPLGLPGVPGNPLQASIS